MNVRGRLARWPLAGFLVVAVVGTLVLALGEGVGISSDYSIVVTGLAALLFCWACSARGDGPGRPILRLTIVIAVFVVNLALAAWSLEHFRNDHVPSFESSYADAIREVLHPDFSSWLPVWLEGLVAGLILGCVWSASDGPRDLVRTLVSWVPGRTGRLLAVLLVVPLAIALCSILVTRATRVQGWAVIPYRASATETVIIFLMLLVTSTTLTFAWFGFAAPRLARTLPPLFIGVLVGVAVELPGLVAMVKSVAAHDLPRRGVVVDELPALAFAVAISIIALWLTRLTPHSLLPVLVFMAAVFAAHGVAFTFAGATFESAWRSSDIYRWAVSGVAVLVVLQGRMWRRAASLDRAEAPSGLLDVGAGASVGSLAGR